VFTRIRLAKVALVAVGLLFAAGLTCDKSPRHKVLTFFFDGVPPSTGVACIDARSEETQNIGQFAQGPTGPRTYKHKPWKPPETECEVCHGEWGKQAEVNSKVPLVTEPPQLCFKCHPDMDYSDSTEVVHGPVAVAQCLFCHHHHVSENAHLLKKPAPQLCFECHEERDIASIPDHSAEAASDCLRCHAGHSTSKKMLLRRSPGQNPSKE